MNRREFLSNVMTLGKCCLLMSLFPLLGACGARSCRSKEGAGVMSMDAHSLKALVSRKLHHGDGCFINPFVNGAHPGGFGRLLQWKLFSKNHFRHQYDQEKVVPVSLDWKPVRGHKGLSVTFISHAGVLIKDGGTTLLVDPVFGGLPFFIKDFTPLNLDLAAMPRPDHVLITHGHYDHLDLPTLKSLGRDTHFIFPLGYREIVTELAPCASTNLDWMEVFTDNRIQVTLLPCNHWTMRNPLVGPNRSLWGSYLIRTAGGRTIYISGDTAYFDGFGAIGRMSDIDLAIINVGAYEPRWFMQGTHMNPDETVRAFQELRARRLVIVHWGTFRLGDEPVFLPPVQVREALAKVGLADRLIALRHGQTVFDDQLS